MQWLITVVSLQYYWLLDSDLFLIQDIHYNLFRSMPTASFGVATRL